MTEDELKVIQKYYATLKTDTAKEVSLQQTHSIDEAGKMHVLKKDIEEKVLDEVKNKEKKD